jgi:hypothetical protein
MNSLSQLHIRKAINSLTLLLSITHHDFLDFQLWFYVPFGGMPLLQHQIFVVSNNQKFTNRHGTPAKFSFADSNTQFRVGWWWTHSRGNCLAQSQAESGEAVGCRYWHNISRPRRWWHVECVAIYVASTSVVPYSDHARKRVVGLRLGEERNHQEYRWEMHFVRRCKRTLMSKRHWKFKVSNMKGIQGDKLTLS